MKKIKLKNKSSKNKQGNKHRNLTMKFDWPDPISPKKPVVTP